MFVVEDSMAHKIGWDEVVKLIDIIDAKVKEDTGISLRESIEKRKARSPFHNEQFFMPTPEGNLPVKTFKIIQ
jgi:hypothetical protein